MIGAFDMELTKKLANGYKRANKRRKGEILTEYCSLTDVSRNTASKRFRKEIRDVYPKVFPRRDKFRKRGPKNKFKSIHKEIVRRCWELGGNICAERLHPMLSTYIDQLDIRGKLKIYSRDQIGGTRSISIGTLKRVIATFPRTSSKKHKGSASIYKQVPIVAHFSQFTDRPGHVKIDFVEHSGGVSSGLFAVTGTYTDIFSGWVVRAAGLGKNENSVFRIDRTAQSRIFHSVLHYHPDNDKSILKVLFERMKSNNNSKKHSFTLSRSRPYRKNDNAHVEQKNDDKVRKLVGYWRYDTPEEVDLLNRLYEKADFLDNFFIPSSKLIKKIRDGNGRVIGRLHDIPKTPYQRLIECEELSAQEKQKLKRIFKSLDMIELRQGNNKILQNLHDIKQQISRKRIMI
jgi:hypothetical protein